MKIILLSFVLYTALSSCHAQETAISRIEFNIGSRTYRDQIIVTPDSTHLVKEDFMKSSVANITKRKTSAEEWKSLLQSLKGIAPNELKELPAPSNQRAADAAAHGSIIITTADGQSFTHAFDDEQPNKRLQPLMKQISVMRKRK